MTDEERVEKYLKTVETTIYDFIYSKVERAYLAGLKEGRKEFEKENAKLKEQIEKMKRCVNCKHSLTMSDTKSPCNYCDTKFNKWELKEK